MRIKRRSFPRCPVCGACVIRDTDREIHIDWHVRNLQ